MLRLTTNAFRGSNFVGPTLARPMSRNLVSSFSKNSFSKTSKQVFSPKSQNLIVSRGFQSTRGSYQYSSSATTTIGGGTRSIIPLIVGGAGVAAIAGLAYYGYTQSETAPGEGYVASRLRYTYFYLFSSLGLTAASAFAFFRSGLAYRMASANPWVVFGISLAGLIGAQIVTRSIPYENFLPKHLAWGTFCAALGAAICPVVSVGGTILLQAAAATGTIVGSLSVISAAAPTGTFMNMGGPLSIGLGVLVAASFGTIIFPASGLLSSLVVYGGTCLFGFFVLHDTQKIKHEAKHAPRYDPINSCIGLTMDTVNIFLNMVQILSGSNRRR